MATSSFDTGDYAVQIWRPLDELEHEDYAAYWNDVDQERTKEWWVADGEFSKMEEYLAEWRLPNQLDATVALAASLGRPLRGRGVDLAAGTLWAVPHLIGHGAEIVYAVEYSHHRLLELGPIVLRHYDVRPDAVVLCQGSFYDLRLHDGSLDFAFMSQAFHHAANSTGLLREVRRVLKPDGVVLMIGEHVIDGLADRLRNVTAALVARTPMVLQRALLDRVIGHRPLRVGHTRPEPDPVLGDHYYFRSDYEAMFEEAGFASRRVHERGAPFQSFVLVAA